MRKSFALLAIIFFSFLIIKAQPANISETSTSKQSSAANTSDANKKDDVVETKIVPKTGGKVAVPPEKARPIVIPKTSIPIVIDGKVDEEVWKSAAVFKDFYQTNPGDNIEPSKPTEVYVMYDEKNLYIAFKCWDEKDKIRATLAKRDEVFGEDNVRIWLDTYNDQRRAYVIGFNPLGIQQDGIFTEGQGADFSVDIVMESKGVIEDWGWSVEAKIPFKSLRYVAGKGKMWGFNAARNIDRFNDEFDQWLPNDRDISGFLVQHGKITGLDEIKTERTLEIVPSVTFSQTGSRVPALEFTNGRFVNQPIKQDIGVTLKYTITPNITLDAAINPDFAEVEADAPVVTANQRFPIFFEEKRPFFLEGVEIFQSPLQVFYSRQIIDPDFAAKLTGKVGKTSFGFLAASDKAPGNLSEDERTSLAICLRERLTNPNVRCSDEEIIDKNAMFGVLRVKRDFGKENNLGFFATYRSFPEQKNLLAGFDGRLKWSPKAYTTFQVLGTTSRRCFFDAEFEPAVNPLQARRNREVCNGSTFSGYRTGNGIAYYANYDYTEETKGFFAEVGGRSKFYRADAGFTRRVNTNFAFAGGRISTKANPKKKIIRASWFNGAGIDYDFQGRLISASWNSNANFNLQRNTFVNLSGGMSRERIFEEEFGLKRMPSRPAGGSFFGAPERAANQRWISGNINSRINKKIAVGAFVGTIFNAFDFDFGGGPRFPRRSPAYLAYLRECQSNPAACANEPALDPGTGRQFDFGLGVELRPTDPLRISLDYNKSRLVRSDTGLTAFDSNIVSLKSTYQFTRFTFVRTRVDYDSIQSNFNSQLLFGWNPNPGTAFYVGYNDNFNYNGFSPITGQYEPRFERNIRTFFIRASYLFRKSF